MPAIRFAVLFALAALALSPGEAMARVWKPSPVEQISDYLFIVDPRPDGSQVMIYWIAPQLAETRALLDAAKDVHARFVLLGESEEHNLGVIGLRMASALAPANEPVRFEIEVANYGVAEAKDVQISLGIDGETPGDDRLR